MLKLFVYDNLKKEVIVNEPDILLIREFKDLWTNDRNKCKEDKVGDKKLKFFKELHYIYLVIDWRTPYKQFTERERHEYALLDSGLSKEEFDDPTFRTACRKYKEMQEKSIIGSLLQSQYNLIHRMKIKYDTMDLDERKDDGTPIHKNKDILGEMASIAKSLDGLKDLEEMYKKEQEAENSLRGDHEPGMFDR